MKAEEFRELIKQYYRNAMEDCQIPTGALAQFNAAEFFAYAMHQEVQRMKDELKIKDERIKRIESEYASFVKNFSDIIS